jgi:two-component system, cell cycle sensor histidine kinase and response regulator CckA
MKSAKPTYHPAHISCKLFPETAPGATISSGIESFKQLISTAAGALCRLWTVIGMGGEGTKRSRAGTGLSESAEQLQEIFSQAAVGIAQIGLDGAWLRINNRYCEMLGYSESELRTKRICDITHPDDLDDVLEARRQLLAGEISSHTMEKRYLRKDGTIFWGRLNRSLARDHDNRPKYFIAIVEDITEKIEAERALRESQQRLRLAQNAAHLGVWDRDLRTGKMAIFGEYTRLYGLAADHPPLTHEEWLSLIHPADRERVQELVRDMLQQTGVWDTEFRVVWPDGSVHWLLGKGTAFYDDSGRAARIAGVNIDITERKRVEEALRESEELFRRVFEEGPLGLALVGKNYHFLKVNGALCQMVGYSEAELLQMSFADITHPDDLQMDVELAERLFRREIPFFQLRKRYVKKNGEIIWAHLTASLIRDVEGEPLHGLAMIEDVTEMKRAQEQALARQNLESLGFLAGGIAHDFNNLLGGILAQAELVAAPGEEIQKIKASAIRGAEIVRGLMIYAGQDQADLIEAVDVSQLVEEMLELLKISISKHAVLRTDLADNLPAVKGNAPQIRQVVMNLVINASEAIGEQEGVINVTTAQVSGGRDLAPDSAKDLAPGDYVRLEVSDNGSGITEETRAKIFDPFFSNKFAGRGLGLAIVQGIVRAHSGAINLVSVPGRETTFQVLLPCSTKRDLVVRSAVTSAGLEQSNARVGTILVVEDEETLRMGVSKTLRRRGFSVMEASDGSAAIDLMRTHKDIDVVLLDVTLPGTPSREVFEEAQRLRVDLKVIVTSAYSKEIVDTSFAGLRVDHFIRKPFQFVDLARALGNALSA